MQTDVIQRRPDISVVIMCYKNIAELGTTLISVASQVNVRIELLVNDDCSYGNTIRSQGEINQIVQKYSDSFEHTIIHVNRKNIGIVRSLNRIMQDAHGEFLCLLGAGDCLVDETVLSMVVGAMRPNNVDVLFSRSYLKINNDKCIVCPPDSVIKVINKGPEDILNLCCRKINYLISIGSFFRTEYLISRGGFDESYVLLEDAPFYLDYLLEGNEFFYLDRFTCIHESGGISNRRTKNPILEEDSIKTLTQIKYPNRKKLRWFTRRVVYLKYYLRTSQSTICKAIHCLQYADAGIYLAYVVVEDWYNRGRYLND